jgi:peptidyl-dipeptidase Dcp
MLIFFPRKGKRNGAWMTSYKSQAVKMKSMKDHMFLSFVISHLNRKQNLQTFNEVTTLFHEFGHALHGMLANTTYPSLSGTSVYWDFGTLPSNGKLVLRTGSIGIICKTL